MLKKMLCAVPLMTLFWLAPSAILAAEPPAAKAAAVSGEADALPEETAALPGEAAALPGDTDVLPGETAVLPGETTDIKKASGPAADSAEIAGNPGSDGAEGGREGALTETGETLPAAEEALLGQPSYTDEDLYVLAHVLAGECQNCPDEEQLYVGSVVLNRTAHPSFPGTVKGVIFQKGQYSCTRDGNYYREPTERNWANARRLLEEGSVLPGNVVWQSGKKQGRGVYVRTKYHYYCY